MDINSLTLKDCEWIDLSCFKNSTIFITGGTGLIGGNLLEQLSAVSAEYKIKLVALVRNKEKGIRLQEKINPDIILVQGDVIRLPEIPMPIDYIIHCASPTASETFMQNPVETITTMVYGTNNVLTLAKDKKVKSMVYLSSMEAYGSPQEKVLLTEDKVDYLNPLKVRSCYPEGKRLCENLCVSYRSEYQVPVKIARLAQTFGTGIPKTDRRVFVQFLQSSMRGEDIDIKASGNSARMYLYSFDAVTAIITTMLYGEDGNAYNIANKESYSSITELAHRIAQMFGNKSKVRTHTGSAEEISMYPPDSYLYLDTSKLEALGWKAKVSLEAGLRELALILG